MSGTITLEQLASSQRRIGDSFGLASWIALIGVLLVWLLIKSEATAPGELSTATTQVLSAPLAQVSQVGQSLTKRGDTAFASGDIVTPPGDNALHYYQEALAAAPADPDALRGRSQVMEYLLNEAESAIYHGDFDLAREDAAKVLAIDPGNGHALDVNLRAARLKQVESLLNEAVALYAAGRLTYPEHDNAGAVYQRVLELDPDNDAARQGLDSVLQRTIANAESALFAGDMRQATAFLDQVRAIDPDAPGISMLEQTERHMQTAKSDQRIKELLLEAAEALQADRLMPPAQPNAFGLYQQMLTQDPDSPAARRGLQLVRNGLLDRARTLLATDDMAEAFAHLDAAERAGASSDEVAELRGRARYRQRLLDAEAGRFESLYPISQLTPIRQTQPNFPRTAPRGASGSVDLHLTVTVRGEVRDIEVLGNPRDYFQRAAVQAVRTWRFEPAMEDGKPIPVRVAVRVTFEG